MFETLSWIGDRLRFIDQTLLPAEETYVDTDDYRVVCDAIRRLAIRGAPAIGVAGAYALALAARGLPDGGFREALAGRAAEIIATRPTAVNLAWAVNRVLAAAPRESEPAGARAALVAAAEELHREDLAVNRRIGANGAGLIPEGATVLTHCNAGALATTGYGTALGVIRAAHERGTRVSVIADETRPLLQGSRLTAWELLQAGIPTTVIADTAAGSMMQRGLVTCVLVGADRIAANGDVANKIGTYPLAVLARAHDIPFYVAAPTSTIDLEMASGDTIPIEERGIDEITHMAGVRIAPEGVAARNPAFDVTPHRLVTAIVTEEGIARPPLGPALRSFVERAEHSRASMARA